MGAGDLAPGGDGRARAGAAGGKEHGAIECYIYIYIYLNIHIYIYIVYIYIYREREKDMYIYIYIMSIDSVEVKVCKGCRCRLSAGAAAGGGLQRVHQNHFEIDCSRNVWFKKICVVASWNGGPLTV